MKIRNVSPRGALDVPLLRATVDAGAVVEVSDVHGAVLLAQVDNWALAGPDEPTESTTVADTEGEPA
jgi:glutamate mutase epsilon subunit